MKQVKSILALTLVSALMLAGCSDNKGSEQGSTGGNSGSTKKTEISLLIGKSEIAKQLEDMVKEFNDTHEGIKLSMIPLAGQNAFEKMTALYSSGNAPTIMSMGGGEITEFKDKLLDLTGEPWVEHAMEGTLDYVKMDDKLVGMPATVEAFGYIYKKETIETALGGSFDPKSIKTKTDLENLFKKLSESGDLGAIHISPLDWSLGAHFTNVFFADQSADRDARHQFMSDLKEGKVNLAENAVYNGWLDTFDMMLEYNNAKKSPLAPLYDDGPLALAGGEVGLWFMGNWAYPQLQEIDPEGTYGFLPVPVSDNAADYGNSQISVGVPAYWTVDASQSSPEQQAAAKEFLNWLVADEKGQEHYVNKLNFIPIYDNITIKPSDSLSQDILAYMESGNTLEWMNNYYPADAYPTMGASLQKYMSGAIDRAGLTNEITQYWTKTAK